jgi:hypothetical protein
MKSGLVDGLGHHEAQSTKHFGADRYSHKRHAAVGIVPFASGKNRRHDHGAGMHGAALEGIVKVLTMRCGAVDEGRVRGIERAPMAYRRAGAIIVARRDRTPHVILVARGDAQSDDIDQQVFAFAHSLGRQVARPQRRDPLGKRLGNGNFWQFGGHAIAATLDMEQLAVARLDRLALSFHRGGGVLHGLDVLQRFAPRLLRGLRMHRAQATDVDDELLGLPAEAERLKQFCRVRIGRTLEDPFGPMINCEPSLA